ncbi:AAA family ATPase [Enterobacter cancerogenus]|uniref:AAA family ATPase n=1 Tax=Enterobacter cancerogenus TaxID=69218 RepID=UPI003818FD8A
MNGKLIVRLIDAALSSKIEQVKILANIVSGEMLSYDPESSKEIAKMVASSFRSPQQRVNPHLIKEDKVNSLILNTEKIDESLDNLILSADNKNRILQVLKEHKNIKKLSAHNLEPAKTILFKGPPGVGKTLTAKWLANEMKLPLKILDLAMVMSSLLGKTGSNLKNVFDEAASSPCILLLDEFDSVAKKRDDDQDIGELKRLVTVLLQSIDSWPSTSILIAATNHAELLDPAIWRRFELKINFDNPDDAQIKEYLLKLTNNHQVAHLFKLFKGMSYSDIKTEVLKSKKASILENNDFVFQLVTDVLKHCDNDILSLDDKKQIAVHLVSAKVSQRKVSELLNISRPTIKKVLTD